MADWRMDIPAGMDHFPGSYFASRMPGVGELVTRDFRHPTGHRPSLDLASKKVANDLGAIRDQLFVKDGCKHEDLR